MGFFRTVCKEHFGGGLKHGACACGERVRPIRFDQGIGAIDRETGLPRLLTAEPALRRAVPTLIIAFLITICLGAFVQVIDQSRQKRAAMKRDLAALTDLLAERLDRLASVRQDRAANIERLQGLLPDLIPGLGQSPAGRHVIITGADHRVLARVPVEAASAATTACSTSSAPRNCWPRPASRASSTT